MIDFANKMIEAGKVLVALAVWGFIALIAIIVAIALVK